MNWVKLTERVMGADLEIYVNLEQVSSIQSTDATTTIWFAAGHKDGKITVTEPPEEIFRKARVKVDS